MSNTLVSVAKQVIRAAAKYGLEEAGTRIMGAAWSPFKAMLSPVIGELEKRYPKFFLLEVPTGTEPPAEAQLASKSAVAALSSDKQLQKMVLDSFNKLEQGQEEIQSQIDKITLRLESINISIDQLSDVNDENFDKVMIQLTAIQQQLDNMGAGLQNQPVIFPIALRLPEDSVETFVKLHIAGTILQLYVNKNRPYATVDVTVPKPGVYSYQLELQEVSTVYNSAGESTLGNIRSTDSDLVEILPNTVYKLERAAKLTPERVYMITFHLSQAEFRNGRLRRKKRA